MDLHFLETILLVTIKIVCYWFIAPLAIVTVIIYAKKVNEK